MKKAEFTRRYTTDVQYEFEEYTVSAELEDDADLREVMAALKADIEAIHAGESSAGSPTEDAGQDTEEENEDPKPVKTGKKSKRSRTTTPKEEPEDEEETEDDDGGDETEDEDGDEGNDDGEESEESPDEEEEESPKVTGKKKSGTAKTGQDSKTKTEATSGKKGFKKKPQAYQRGNETHKELFSNVLKKVAPNWKKSFESKAQAKTTSKKMEGSEFLDENGKTLASFEAAVKKLMGKFK